MFTRLRATIFGILALLLVVGITFGIVSYARKPTGSALLLSNRAKWDARGSSTYSMTVQQSWLPAPPIGVIISVREGKIVKETLISCENPTENYPKIWCEPAQYNYQRGAYTVIFLFERADSCIKETKAAISKCPTFSSAGFQGFTSAESLVEAARSCTPFLQSTETLCSVEYEPELGYPKSISYYAPLVLDGFGTVTVQELKIDK